MKRCVNLVFTCLFLTILSVIFLLAIDRSKNHVDNRVKKNNVTKISQERQKNKLINSILSGMTLDEKVGQLFWARVPYYNQVEDLQTYHLGGYVLFGKDFEGQTLESIKELTESYQSVSKIPLLIGSDEEGGAVTRISALLDFPFQSPMALYQNGGINAVTSDVELKAELLKSVGINAGLFPVADISFDPNSFIYNRTIGEDVGETCRYIKQVVQVLDKVHFGSTLKHFPGYGENGDTHSSIIQDNRSLDDLRKIDFKPFEAGIKAGSDSILVSHNILTEIDNVPSSISPKINRILRKDLHFNKVIMSDDLDMAGLADFVNQEEAAYQVITAGNDLILSSSYQIQIPYLLEKIASGEISENRIDESVKRILSWKYDLGLLKK